MEIEIIKTVQTTEIIDIEFPYYYKRDMDAYASGEIIYGKIENNRCIEVRRKKEYKGDFYYQFDFYKFKDIKETNLSFYLLNKDYKIDEAEFYNVSKIALEFTKSLIYGK